MNKFADGVFKSEIRQNQELAEKLHKPFIKIFEKRKVYSSFKNNIWGTDFADMQSRRKYNIGFQFLLRVIDIYSKYAWFIPSETKKSITDAFQKFLNESNREPNKIWRDKDANFTIDQWNHGYRVIIQRCIQHIMKEHLLLVKEWLKL